MKIIRDVSTGMYRATQPIGDGTLVRIAHGDTHFQAFKNLLAILLS